MEYKYAANENYEDYASGRVIYGQMGSPNYPVRLAAEIFARCLSYIPKQKGIILYDPCCGGGYTLTVLGFLYGEVLSAIVGSDINEKAIRLARENVSLLSIEGMQRRKAQLEKMVREFGKASHEEALKSVEHLSPKQQNQIETKIFVADILQKEVLQSRGFTADIVFADVPYGELVAWSGGGHNPIDMLLDTLEPVISKDTILGISSAKGEKISNHRYKRLEKLKIGKRKVEILKPMK